MCVCVCVFMVACTRVCVGSVLEVSLCVCLCVTNLDGAEVHGVFDDVVVVMQAKGLGVYWHIEGPAVGDVLLGLHLPQNPTAVPQLLAPTRTHCGQNSTQE